ncbi:MAG: hypothetical protein A3K03_12585 [Bdellovibrionales bacterium RIFOXYD1_FULL_44_7]|nr:MAG: hypothetical protein A3K03_12585 [Bdellovibrionales bacterium RIFOXYD1_FULL_44_7]
MHRSRVSKASKIWISVFAVWCLLLSGLLTGVIGSPGVLQALRLKSLLDTKQMQLSAIEAEISRLDGEVVGLEKNRFVQEREVRRVLGYAAPDEIVFDFTERDSLEKRDLD